MTNHNRPEADSQEYKRWRFLVYKRDAFCCQMCGNNQKLEAHHIIKWADAPQLRYVVSNGITLCEKCHSNVTSNEYRYAEQFKRIVEKKKFEKQFKNKKGKFKYKAGNPRLRF